ncbi:hypothetical protein ACEPAF_2221 [Sanghuangporus sanghuang]|uniref:Uncharacterized protein n=1 Tax=Sanghuangporus baumii TaxID=108892 RepID=A0A9Q5NFF4_SANBA|nr:hypothetical protein A7U60_g253 [Sanghuangporus baumii]
MLRNLQHAGAFKPPLGARLVSSKEVAKLFNDDWFSTRPQERDFLLGGVDEKQWEGRGFHKTPITMLCSTDYGPCTYSAGVHRSRDPINHFTGRAFDADGKAVWLFDKKYRYYTNAIHFYPGGLPEGYDIDRFAHIPSDDANLIVWCATYKWDIKTGKRIDN